ncbi:coat protein [peach-associated luteovirus 2]|nr:coat protein [peach-associated luteovirus 2]
MPKGKNKSKGKKKGRKGRNGKPKSTVVVNVQSNGGRRSAGGNARGNSVPNAGSGVRSDKFTFTVDDVTANSSGVIKFGPSLSQYPNFSNGIIKSFHEYKITNLQVSYISFASSTTAGAFAIEIDTARKQSDVESRIISFPVNKGHTRSFPAKLIRGLIWHSTKEDQFYFLYKGNGKADVAGQFKFTFFIDFQGPK